MKSAETVTPEQFLADRHGKTFADVFNDRRISFERVLQFFSDADRQQRMEDSEIHHDRPPLAGVVRELEAEPVVGRFFETLNRRHSVRLRQAIGVVVRMIMERRGWVTTGKKGSLGVRAAADSRTPNHNAGGLSLWFIRAERYRRVAGMPFRTVRDRCEELNGRGSVESSTDLSTANRAHESPRRASGS